MLRTTMKKNQNKCNFCDIKDNIKMITIGRTISDIKGNMKKIEIQRNINDIKDMKKIRSNIL